MSILERHADKWTPLTETGCFLWTGGHTGGPIPRPSAGWNGRSANVARIVCEERYGAAPSEKPYALHSTPNGCIGGSCVNPDHLRWGSQFENMQDVPSKVRSDRIRHGAAKMTKEARMERHRKMLAKRWP